MSNKGVSTCFRSGKFFAASNSCEGFKSYYDKVFDREKLRKLYIIKGGPGTGKSSFLRCVADYAEKKRKCVEYYNCSSDPDSLDGIIIEGKIALIDGTAPHSADTEIPGARDEIIDLGSFWDSDRLQKRFDDIKILSDEKKACYSKGYRYLSGCGDLAELNRLMTCSALKEDKMLGCVERMVASFPSGDGFKETPALTDSFGMKGRVKYDTFEKYAEKLYYIEDWYSSAHLFLAALVTMAKRKGLSVFLSYDPIIPDRLDGVYFADSGTAFVISDGNDLTEDHCVRVNMKRFMNRSIVSEFKSEFRYNLRLYEALLNCAAEAFVKAGEFHFKLEGIYSECMDFSAKERFTASFCEKIFSENMN